LRYIVFSQPEHAAVITLWIMHTWFVDCADFTPYIYLHSPVMRCGKTQVQRVVEPLVRNPLRTCNVSEAALYREIEESHPTLLWDEIDAVFGNRKSSEANENLFPIPTGPEASPKTFSEFRELLRVSIRCGLL